MDRNRPGAEVDPKDKDKKEPKIENKANILDFPLKAKKGDGDWMGYFTGDVIIREPGEWEFQVPIPGVAPSDSLRQSVLVRKANPELDSMTRRFWVCLALSLPVFILEMGQHLGGAHLLESISPRNLNWVQLVLATPVVLWGGWPFFQRGWASLVHRSLNMFTLIAIGTGVAWTYSIVAVVWPEIFPASFRGHGGQVAVYFEAY